MSGLPYLKFFPTDWQADPAVRMCSIAARGLWFEMLCLMHQAKGYLRIGEKNISPAQLARLVGILPSESETLLAELEEAGVFSRDAAGSIYCRRMLRDIERAELPDPTARERMRRFRNKHRNGHDPQGPDPTEDFQGRYGKRNANRNQNVTLVTPSARAQRDLSPNGERDQTDRFGNSGLEDGISNRGDGAARRVALSDVEKTFAGQPAQLGRIVARLNDPEVVYPEAFAKKCIRNATGRRAAKSAPEAPPTSFWVVEGTSAWIAWQNVDPQPAVVSKYFRDPGRMRPSEFPLEEVRA